MHKVSTSKITAISCLFYINVLFSFTCVESRWEVECSIDGCCNVVTGVSVLVHQLHFHTAQLPSDLVI